MIHRKIREFLTEERPWTSHQYSLVHTMRRYPKVEVRKFPLIPKNRTPEPNNMRIDANHSWQFRFNTFFTMNFRVLISSHENSASSQFVVPNFLALVVNAVKCYLAHYLFGCFQVFVRSPVKTKASFHFTFSFGSS